MCTYNPYDNDHARFEMERSARQVAQDWRFRHLQSLEGRVLSAVVGNVRGFVQRALHSESAAIGSIRQQPSY